MPRSEKSKRKKVKVKTENKEIVETDIDISYQTYLKTIISASSICNLLLKSRKYQRFSFFLDFLQIF